MARALLLVIDSLGVGAMADVAETPPAELGANTQARVLDAKPHLPARPETMGLGGVEPSRLNPGWPAALGTNLQHQGPTAMGHQS